MSLKAYVEVIKKKSYIMILKLDTMSNSRLLVTGTFPYFSVEYLENSKRSLDTKVFLSYT